MNIIALHKAEKQVSALQLFKGESGTATAIQLQKEGILKEHITKIPALLLCVTGNVTYKDEEDNTISLRSGDYINIIPHIKHWLEAQEDSQLVLLK